MKQSLKTALLVISPLLLVGAGITIPTVFSVPITFQQGIKTDSILNSAGTSGAPGMVPIGGMVAVIPEIDTTNSWQPPSGANIKDGFMRANGSVVPSGQGSPLQGRTLPNMETLNRYPRASNATSWVTGTYTTGGANTQATNVTLSAHSITQPAVAAHTITQPVISAHSITQPTFMTEAHYHGKGDLNIINGVHSHGAIANGGSGGGATVATWGVAGATSANLSNFGYTGSASLSLGGSYVGLPTASGGVNGDTDQSATRTTNVGVAPHSLDTPVGVSAHSLSTLVAVSDHTVTNNAVNNEPAYVEVVWVIRVK
jgi:hypothetical protein